MNEIKALTYRNIKLFFKDKGLFFTSLITPLILLVLYITFLANVYTDSLKFVCAPNGGEATGIYSDILNGLVSGQLISSLLAVCCVTVAFCSNMLMVQDKASGARVDLDMAPVKGWKLSVAYYIASAFSTLVICFIALAAGLVYIAVRGWFLSVTDVLLLVLDVFLLSMFGTAFSSVINFFLSSQGQISAVGTIVSSCYGFVCGAYMPISQFSPVLQKVISFLPGTYGTALVRNHAMSGPLRKLSKLGTDNALIEEAKDSMDCNLYFFGNKVGVTQMYLVLGITIFVLCGIYVLLNAKQRKKG